ncbi:DUF2339 domain-containing protein [Phenylobacterium sp.]|uniref:DUF2339 domain-containing protein n=1 Tax=Phenylobacterium sp. TaxID=1871053 RepID=UPI003D2C7710
MIWFVALALGAWVFILSFQLADLRAHVHNLERRLAELKARLDDSVQPAAKPVKPRTSTTAEPVQDASAADPLRDVLAVSQRGQPESVTDAAPTIRLRPPPPRPSGPPLREVVRAWLEENGLAWAGGAALALGGLFLVTYAAQRGVFTPPLRIAAAMMTGFVLLGASEWLKSKVGNPLAAALAAGAGAATLYGAAWASYWLYAFIGLAPAAGLMAVISFGLLTLAFRHGEPLAVLAVFGGFLAPVVTGPQEWSAPALTGYLALMIATGFGVAAVRAWGRTGVTALAGAFLWGVAGFAAEDNARVVALAVAPMVLAYAAVEWRRRKGEAAVGDPGPGNTFVTLPAFSLIAAGLLVVTAWFSSMTGAWLAPVSVGSILVALLTALGDRRGLIPAPIQAIGYAPALAFLGLSFRDLAPADVAQAEIWGGVLIAAMAAAGVMAATGQRTRVSRLGGAAAGLVAVAIALSLQGPLTQPVPWLPDAGAALILLAGAAVIARTSAEPQRDLSLAIWLWAAGGGALVALQQGIDPRGLPVTAAGLSLVAAVMHARLGWRGFAAVMVGSAVASLGALISPEVFEALEDGRLRWWALAAVAAAAAGLTHVGSRLSLRPDRPRESAEALSTTALVIGLAGVILLLRHAATSGAVGGGGLDHFVEASLRTLLILVAGLTSAQSVRADSSVIARWRGQVLLGLGLAHGLLLQALTLNPVFADGTPRVAGPPLLDSLALGFLAPAVILGFATWKKVSVKRWLLAAYTIGAGVFAVVWAFMETRRLFQGASLAGGFDGIGRAEAAAYAVLAVAVARALIWVGERAARRPWSVSSLSGDFVRAGQGVSWAALGLAVLVFGWGASPWWGPIDRPLAGAYATGLLFGVYALGAVAAYLLSQAVATGGPAPLARAARLVGVGIVFALTNLVVRFGFHGYDMRPVLRDQSVETWAFSAVWGLFGFGLLVYGAARRSNDLRTAGMGVLMLTLAKIFLFDMSRLDGVIRAASFLAVGTLLLGAAVIVRRLGGTQALPFGLGGKREAEEQ